MKPTGVFLFVDDDTAEQTLLKIAVETLEYTNKIVFCFNGLEALEYLKKTTEKTFLILSDLNMPRMNGIELKQEIENIPKLKLKAIPFIFHTSSCRLSEIKAAYSLNAQGYFQKAQSIDGTIYSLEKIISYWTNCIHPKDLYKFCH